jgi:hypothetical protein
LKPGIKRITALSPEQRQLFSQLLKERGVETAKNRTIPQYSGTARLSLSFAQQRLWFLDQLAPGNPAYNYCYGISLKGKLDRAVLEQTLNEIVRRHKSLRTTFRVVEGQPTQVIAPALTLKLPVVDLRGFPETEREARLHRLATEETHHPCDLGRGPLLWMKLLRLTEEEHVLLLTIHHIISDGWSFRVLFQELATIYNAFSKGSPSPLPELPIQYVDFAVWEQQWMQGKVLESLLSYWKQQLGGNLSQLELPTDRPPPAAMTCRGAGQSWRLEKPLIEALKVLNLAESLTPFMTMMAVFQTLLHCYTGQKDILIGFSIANRDWAETEGLIGHFVNTLVLRSDLSRNPSFRELLRRVRSTTLGAYAHQDLPFEKLVQELNVKRELSRNPLFNVFILQYTPPAPITLPDLTLKSLLVESGITNFDLDLWMIEEGEDLTIHLRYNTHLFNASTIMRMLGHFGALLRHAVQHPDVRLSGLKEILAQADRQGQAIKRKERQTIHSRNLKYARRKPIQLES